jgi:hypothetical protein
MSNGWLYRCSPLEPTLEDKTAGPKPLSAAGTLTSHARVNKVVLAITHEATIHIAAMIANVGAGVEHIRGTAPQLAGKQLWLR